MKLIHVLGLYLVFYKIVIVGLVIEVARLKRKIKSYERKTLDSGKTDEQKV